MKCHYQTLGVPRDASTEAIKAAFRKLSLETHPDVAVGAGDAERFKQISHAASILTSPEKRRMYDLQTTTFNPFATKRPVAAPNTAAARAQHRPQSSGMRLFYEINRPRNLILGPILFFSAVASVPASAVCGVMSLAASAVSSASCATFSQRIIPISN